jgi:anti-anti-sigma factor
MTAAAAPYVVRLTGECDVSRYPDVRALLGTVPDSTRYVLIDLSLVTIVDSLCLAEFLMAKSRWERQGAVVATLVMNPGVYRLMSIANLTNKLAVFRDEDAAMRFLSAASAGGKERFAE